MDEGAYILIFIFLIVVFTVIWYTVLNRPIGHHRAQFDLFWSYKEWISGDWELGKEIMANMAMFIPFGFLLSAIFPTRRFIIPAAILFSFAIETLQLIMALRKI